MEILLRKSIVTFMLRRQFKTDSVQEYEYDIGKESSSYVGSIHITIT